MVAAAPAVPLLSGVGTAAAGTGLSAGALSLASGGTLLSGSIFSGMAAGSLLSLGTLSTIGTGLSLAGQVYGMFAEQSYADASLATSNLQMETRNRELQLQQAREQTELARRKEQREQHLRRILASQRASFAGAGIDAFSGSPLNIQESTIEEIQREQELDTLQTDMNTDILKINQISNEVGGFAESTGIKRQASSSFTNSLISIGTQGKQLAEML